MKFPQSMFSEGGQARIGTATARDPQAARARPSGLKRPMNKAGAKIDFGAPLRDEPRPAAEPARAAAAGAATARRRGFNPWGVGVGVCLALGVLAVMLPRQFLPATEPAAIPLPQRLGQVEPTPQEAQLQSAPPTAGPAEMQPQAQAQAQEEAPPAMPAKTDPSQGQVLAQSAPQAQAPQPREPAPEPVVAAQAAVPDDAGITAQIKGALAADALLAAAAIDVHSAQGVVTLAGEVPDALLLSRATVIASGMAGVKSVDNRLTLPPPVARQAQQQAQSPDPQIAAALAAGH